MSDNNDEEEEEPLKTLSVYVPPAYTTDGEELEAYPKPPDTCRPPFVAR
jgi:hypothetical protein